MTIVAPHACSVARSLDWPCWRRSVYGFSNAQFTRPTRHDKTVLSASWPAVWIESRDRPAKSEQLADRSPSSRGVWWRSLGLVICSSQERVYILRGVQRHCVWAVGRLGVAACVACVTAAVDWQARRSCLVWCGGAIGRRTSAFCVGVRPAVALRRPTHSDADQTQDALSGCRADSVHIAKPDTTEYNSSVCVLSGVAVWIIFSLNCWAYCNL